MLSDHLLESENPPLNEIRERINISEQVIESMCENNRAYAYHCLERVLPNLRNKLNRLEERQNLTNPNDNQPPMLPRNRR